MDLDTRTLTITVSDLRMAGPEEQARFGFVPCQASELGLPAWWGQLELWIGNHQKMEIPLLVHEKVAAAMMTEHSTVDIDGQLVSVPARLYTKDRSSKYFPTWFQVEAVNPSTMNRVWVEHMVMIHGGLRNGLVPVRFGISPAPLWIRATALPPPPGQPASMRAKLMLNRLMRSGLELQSLFLYGYLAPYGEELPTPGKSGGSKKKGKSKGKKPARPAAPPGDEPTTEEVGAETVDPEGTMEPPTPPEPDGTVAPNETAEASAAKEDETVEAAAAEDSTSEESSADTGAGEAHASPPDEDSEGTETSSDEASTGD